jgi:hypothetical protein
LDTDACAAEQASTKVPASARHVCSKEKLAGHLESTSQNNTHTIERDHGDAMKRDHKRVVSTNRFVEQRKEAEQSHKQSRNAWRYSARLLAQAEGTPAGFGGDLEKSVIASKCLWPGAWHVLVPDRGMAVGLRTDRLPATWPQSACLQCAAAGRELGTPE